MIYHHSTLNNAYAFSTTRKGGVSHGAYSSFNANHYCGDNPADVNANRELLCKRLGIVNDNLIVPHQTHDTRTLVINENYLKLPYEVRTSLLEGIDAVCTDMNNVCVCVSTADCIPVLIHDENNGAVSAIHAGWRGTVARIVQENIKVMTSTYGTRPEECKAVIGPGISLDAFEVGDEVYEQFETNGFPMDKIARRFPARLSGESRETTDYKKWHIDLPLCNKLQLMECGIPENNITLSGICTYNQSDDFFSARKLGIRSGRILNGIMMK